MSVLASATWCTSNLAAHDIITTNLTFSRDISRILANRCAACHGANASIPLSTYEQVRPWAVAIKDQVLARSMPPWGAVKGFGDLMPDAGLNQEEIMLIAAWVIGGAPQGDPGLLKKPSPVSRGPVGNVVHDAFTIDTRGELKEPIAAVGIRPIADTTVDSARVIARLPDGRLVPLLWLYQLHPEGSRTFTFRRPVELPRGTIVESSAPLRFAIEQRSIKPEPGS